MHTLNQSFCSSVQLKVDVCFKVAANSSASIMIIKDPLHNEYVHWNQSSNTYLGTTSTHASSNPTLTLLSYTIYQLFAHTRRLSLEQQIRQSTDVLLQLRVHRIHLVVDGCLQLLQVRQIIAVRDVQQLVEKVHPHDLLQVPGIRATKHHQNT